MTKVMLSNKVQVARRWRWCKTDPLRGYAIPPYAVAGTSYTGDSSDSPCPYEKVKPELDKLSTYLKEMGIHAKLKQTESSNVFMVKIWVVAPSDEYLKAKELADDWLRENNNALRYLHDAEGSEKIEATEDELIAEEEKEKAQEPKVMQKMTKHAHISIPLLQKVSAITSILIPDKDTIIKKVEEITKENIPKKHTHKERLRA